MLHSSHNQRTQHTLPNLEKRALSVSLNYGMGFLGLFILDPRLENNHKLYITLKMAYQQENIRTDPKMFEASRLQHHEIESHLPQQKNSSLTKIALVSEDCCYEKRVTLVIQGSLYAGLKSVLKFS